MKLVPSHYKALTATVTVGAICAAIAALSGSTEPVDEHEAGVAVERKASSINRSTDSRVAHIRRLRSSVLDHPLDNEDLAQQTIDRLSAAPPAAALHKALQAEERRAIPSRFLQEHPELFVDPPEPSRIERSPNPRQESNHD